MSESDDRTSDAANPKRRRFRSLTPEARRREARQLKAQINEHVGPGTRTFEIIKRVVVGTFEYGFIQAGNLAYMSMLAIFPFIIVGAAIFSALGEQEDLAAMMQTILVAMPPMVADTIEPVATEVLEARTGNLLWIGAIVGLWTVGSLIEAVRDVLRRSYGTEPVYAIWKYRLVSTGIVFLAVILLMFSLIAQFTIGAAQEFIHAYFPWLTELLDKLALTRIIPAIGLYVSLYLMFYLLTPLAYRSKRYPKWPGVLLVTLWWIAVTVALPPLLRSFFSYDLTYGSLAGSMTALFFFYLVGLGIVVGGELNAALVETPEVEDAAVRADDQRINDKTESSGESG